MSQSDFSQLLTLTVAARERPKLPNTFARNMRLRAARVTLTIATVKSAVVRVVLPDPASPWTPKPTAGPWMVVKPKPRKFYHALEVSLLICIRPSIPPEILESSRSQIRVGCGTPVLGSNRGRLLCSFSLNKSSAHGGLPKGEGRRLKRRERAWL